MAHDPAALHVYEANHRQLVSYAGKLSGDSATAEDIVHDAWLLLNGRMAAAEVREPLGYLRRIIRNLVFARARRRAREAVLPDSEMEDFAEDRPSAEADLIAREAAQRVLDALASLPPKQGVAVRMYYFEGLKLRQIAQRLGLSISYTHSLIADGLEICNRRRRGET